MATTTKVQSSHRLIGIGSSREPAALSPVEREIVCAVLDDSVDQLAVLGGIMPDYSSSAAAVEHVRPSHIDISLYYNVSLYYV